MIVLIELSKTVIIAKETFRDSPTVIVINGAGGTLARGRAELRLLLRLMLLLMLKRVREVQVDMATEIVGRRGGIRWRLMHCKNFFLSQSLIAIIVIIEYQAL